MGKKLEHPTYSRPPEWHDVYQVTALLNGDQNYGRPVRLVRYADLDFPSFTAKHTDASGVALEAQESGGGPALRVSAAGRTTLKSTSGSGDVLTVQDKDGNAAAALSTLGSLTLRKWSAGGEALSVLTSGGATALRVHADGNVSLGANAAAAGLFRLPNQQWVAGRNAANSADVNILQVDGSDRVSLANGMLLASATQLSAAGPLLFTPDNTHSIGASGATRPRSVFAALSLSVGSAPSTQGVVNIYSTTNGDLSVLDLDGVASAKFQMTDYATGGGAFGGGGFLGRHGRGTLAVPVDVAVGDRLGFIVFSGYAGGAFRNTGAIEAMIDAGTVSGTSLPTYMRFLTTADGSTSRTERWRISGAGHFLAGADNSYDIGAAAATRPRDLHLARDAAIAGKVGIGAAVSSARMVTVVPTAVGTIGVRINAIASQTANLQEWANSSGVALLGVTKDCLLRWIFSGNVQTTVGSAGPASALPATPEKYLKVVDESGNTLVIPAYKS